MLEVSGLYKSFAKKPALEGVSFVVQRGEIFGLLGHNGAGKSTTLGVILGMVTPQKGEAFIGGVSVQKERSRALAQAGASFESPSFYEYMSGWDNLRVLMSYSGYRDEKRVREVVAEVGLEKRIKSQVGTYSHGMRQRLALAQALLPEPKVLLLDVPTDGLDPEGIKWFRDFVLKLRDERGMTVLFNSHFLAEVEQICDRVAIVREGKLVYEGGVEGIADEHVRLRLDASPVAGVREGCLRFGGVETGKGLWLFPERTDPGAVSKSLIEHGVTLREMRRERRSLEDLYLKISGKGEG